MTSLHIEPDIIDRVSLETGRVVTALKALLTMDRRYTHPSPHEQFERRRRLLKSIQETPGKPVPEVITALRRELRLTLEEFSKLTGVSPRVIHAVEHGRGNPTLNTVEKLLSLFGLSLGVVFK